MLGMENFEIGEKVKLVRKVYDNGRKFDTYQSFTFKERLDLDEAGVDYRLLSEDGFVIDVAPAMIRKQQTPNNLYKVIMSYIFF